MTRPLQRHSQQPEDNASRLTRDDDGHLRSLLTAYIFGAISPAGRTEVETHLEGCEACREEYALLRETAELVSGLCEDPQAGDSEYSFEERRVERVLTASRKQHRFLPRWAIPLGAAAAALLLIVSLMPGFFRSGRRGVVSSAWDSSPANGVMFEASTDSGIAPSLGGNESKRARPSSQALTPAESPMARYRAKPENEASFDPTKKRAMERRPKILEGNKKKPMVTLRPDVVAPAKPKGVDMHNMTTKKIMRNSVTDSFGTLAEDSFTSLDAVEIYNTQNRSLRRNESWAADGAGLDDAKNAPGQGVDSWYMKKNKDVAGDESRSFLGRAAEKAAAPDPSVTVMADAPASYYAAGEESEEEQDLPDTVTHYGRRQLATAARDKSVSFDRAPIAAGTVLHVSPDGAGGPLGGSGGAGGYSGYKSELSELAKNLDFEIQADTSLGDSQWGASPSKESAGSLDEVWRDSVQRLTPQTAAASRDAKGGVERRKSQKRGSGTRGVVRTEPLESFALGERTKFVSPPKRSAVTRKYAEPPVAGTADPRPGRRGAELAREAQQLQSVPSLGMSFGLVAPTQKPKGDLLGTTLLPTEQSPVANAAAVPADSEARFSYQPTHREFEGKTISPLSKRPAQKDLGLGALDHGRVELGDPDFYRQRNIEADPAAPFLAPQLAFEEEDTTTKIKIDHKLAALLERKNSLAVRRYERPDSTVAAQRGDDLLRHAKQLEDSDGVGAVAGLSDLIEETKVEQAVRFKNFVDNFNALDADDDEDSTPSLATAPRNRKVPRKRTATSAGGLGVVTVDQLSIPEPEVGDEGLGRQGFRDRYGVNPFVDTRIDHHSTFAMDVDTAAYSRSRDLLSSGRLPEASAVRVEAFVNSFSEELPADPAHDFSVFCEGAPSPFGADVDLVKISVKARELDDGERLPALLTLAVDTSGSMFIEGRLQTVRESLSMLVDTLDPADRIAIVAYGSEAYLALPHTPARERERILSVLGSLIPRGDTNVEAGLDLAYRVADDAFATRAMNRVVLLSDGVATSGAQEANELVDRVEMFADRGLYLSVVGFGRERYDDTFLQTLAQSGNGNYAYVDNVRAAHDLFVRDLPSTLQVLARDAKIQVEFDPAVVSHYRLLGYVNRDIKDSDFRNDAVDAGEVGPGATVTALYEVRRHPGSHGSLGRVAVRYFATTMGRVEELGFPLQVGVIATSLSKASDEFVFTACLAECAELLMDSYWARTGSFGRIAQVLSSVGPELGARPEFSELVSMVNAARQLTIARGTR